MIEAQPLSKTKTATSIAAMKIRRTKIMGRELRDETLSRRKSSAKHSSFCNRSQSGSQYKRFPAESWVFGLRKFFDLPNLRLLDIVTGSATDESIWFERIGGL
jgi:hypothetical protein